MAPGTRGLLCDTAMVNADKARLAAACQVGKASQGGTVLWCRHTTTGWNCFTSRYVPGGHSKGRQMNASRCGVAHPCCKPRRDLVAEIASRCAGQRPAGATCTHRTTAQHSTAQHSTAQHSTAQQTVKMHWCRRTKSTTQRSRPGGLHHTGSLWQHGGANEW